ncbi:MAG: low-specificity L-threonine aldolase [Chloroflexi bacterium]|nr:low-specificity L-threonine aldolase [Chloroflexota bacterium]
MKRSADPAIDFRSDTVTHPTPAMRRAMVDAEVGDDVFGDDPTVKKLEALAAEMVGKEAALYVSSGTMANATAMLTHLRRGDEVILGARSHIYLNEQGGLAALAGAQAAPILENADGALPLDAIEAAVREDDEHCPITRLVCIENTHNLCGGQPVSVEHTEAVGALARKYGLKFHIDGARLFNAAVALNVSAEALARPADSVSFCLSKGLCAPVGSLVCGSREFVRQARRARKLLGGGMRQAGVIAAAGIVALTSMVERLSNDHDDAQLLAQGLAKIPGIVFDPATVKTNMVYFDLAPEVPFDAAALEKKMKERGVLMLTAGPRRMRMVLHYWISPTDVERAVEVFREVMA